MAKMRDSPVWSTTYAYCLYDGQYACAAASFLPRSSRSEPTSECANGLTRRMNSITSSLTAVRKRGSVISINHTSSAPESGDQHSRQHANHDDSARDRCPCEPTGQLRAMRAQSGNNARNDSSQRDTARKNASRNARIDNLTAEQEQHREDQDR